MKLAELKIILSNPDNDIDEWLTNDIDYFVCIIDQKSNKKNIIRSFAFTWGNVNDQ